jgi:hypothetical protein
MHIFHWWPGREYRKQCPIPAFLVKEAERMGSRYLTFAIVETEERAIWGHAFCCPKDVPSRKMGKQIAVGRVMAMIEDFGFEVDEGLLQC